MTTKAVDRLGKKLPEGEELPKFCRQHADQAMGQKGIWVNNHYIEFDGQSAPFCFYLRPR